MTLAQDNNSLYNFTYNSGGQLTGETVTYPGYSSSPLVTLGFTYDAFGNRIGMTDSLGGSMGYSYNGENQMAGMSLALNGTTAASLTMNYDGLARLSGTTMSTPSGATIASTNSYDNASRLTNISYTNMGSTLASYNYSYNAASEITNYQDNSGNALAYGYDYSGELTSASGTLAGSNYNQTWSYDANGNRNMSGYSTGTGNQLLSDGVNNYTYDKNGNTLTQTNIATGTVTNYSWDYANRLTEVKVVSSGGTVLNDEKFTYDIFGNRIGVSLNGTQTLYTVYDGSNPYMDLNGNGQLTQRYLYNPDALNQFYGQVNGSGTTEWFLTDNLNSIRQVLSANGVTLSTIVYDPFGQLLTSLNSYAPRFLYTGGAYDPITGFFSGGGGEFNTIEGRFLCLNQSGSDTAINTYQLANNSPVNLNTTNPELPDGSRASCLSQEEVQEMNLYWSYYQRYEKMRDLLEGKLFAGKAKDQLENMLTTWKDQNTVAWDELMHQWNAWFQSGAAKDSFDDAHNRYLKLRADAIGASIALGSRVNGRRVSQDTFVRYYLLRRGVDVSLHSGSFDDYKAELWRRVFELYSNQAAENWNYLLNQRQELKKALGSNLPSFEVGVEKGEVKGLYIKDGRFNFAKWEFELRLTIRLEF